MALYAFDRVERIPGHNMPKPTLSPRQRRDIDLGRYRQNRLGNR